MRMPFVKMHGAGNDFILVDNQAGYLNAQNHSLIRQLCDRHTGIGADGLLLLTPGGEGDFHLQYFNADGYPAAICGNGARCAVMFAWQKGWASAAEAVKFTTEETQYMARVINAQRVAVKFHLPRNLQPLPELASEIGAKQMWRVHAGVPHVVALMPQPPSTRQVLSLGKRLRYHPEFQPEGTNVNFISLESPGVFRARVYERGVEAETLACGTGALACGWIALQFFKMHPPVQIIYPGGVLTIYPDDQEEALWLEGPVAEVFQGTISLPPIEGEQLA